MTIGLDAIARVDGGAGSDRRRTVSVDADWRSAVSERPGGCRQEVHESGMRERGDDRLPSRRGMFDPVDDRGAGRRTIEFHSATARLRVGSERGAALSRCGGERTPARGPMNPVVVAWGSDLPTVEREPIRMSVLDSGMPSSASASVSIFRREIGGRAHELVQVRTCGSQASGIAKDAANRAGPRLPVARGNALGAAPIAGADRSRRISELPDGQDP